MKLRWEDELAPWEPPTNETAPGALFNARTRSEHWQMYGMIGYLQFTGTISKKQARAFFSTISGV